MMNEEKQKALEAALGHIEKQYGKGSVMKLGDSSAHMQIEAVPFITILDTFRLPRSSACPLA